MNVLHLPYNVGSQISVSVRALRAIGVNARGIVLRGPSDTIQTHEDVEFLPEPPPLPRGLRWARQHAERCGMLMSAIAWADVLHWHFGYLVLRNGLDLRFARLLGKPGIAEFWGDDIRIAEIEAADNAYYAAHAPAEYLREVTSPRSIATQSTFANAGFECMVCDAQMRSYVREEIWPEVHQLRQRIFVSDYLPAPPDPGRRRPLIVHSPSDPGRKGTTLIVAAIESLRTEFDFDFRLVTGVPRAEALAILSDADIFVDQIVFGSHGLATLEAMAMAKPVVCYLKPSVLAGYPPEIPIVNANPDTFAGALAQLLRDGERRRRLGLAGREYVEAHHDALKLAGNLKQIYEAAIAKRRGRSTGS